jgi:CBS-domain-containing membrane protein
MRIIDKELDEHLLRYLFQCGLATLTIFLVFLVLDVVLETSIVASLGATCFIVFTMPHSHAAQLRPLLGGYAIGILYGSLGAFAVQRFGVTYIALGEGVRFVLFGSLAVGLTILSMVITSTEHPPAAGMALGLVIESWDVRTILFIFGAIALLVMAKRVFRRWLINLS